MEILINITDADEIEELKECATDNNMSVGQYASNIVSQWLKARVKNEYLEYVKRLENADLKTKFGDYKKLKKVK